MLYTYFISVLLCVAGSSALYDSSSDVIELTQNNFDRLVTQSNEVWLVEFYAPWCGHCKNLVPEYKKAARALKGVVKVGAIDADTHKALASQYAVSGFPTIKVFKGAKHSPYQGPRTADALVEAALTATKEVVFERLGKKGGSGSDKLDLYGHRIPWITKPDTTVYWPTDRATTADLTRDVTTTKPGLLRTLSKAAKRQTIKYVVPKTWVQKPGVIAQLMSENATFNAQSKKSDKNKIIKLYTRGRIAHRPVVRRVVNPKPPISTKKLFPKLEMLQQHLFQKNKVFEKPRIIKVRRAFVHKKTPPLNT